jgi:hypothetical protein
LLGILARDGRAGKPKDNKAAYYHFRIATLQGGGTATSLVASDLRFLTSELNAGDVSTLDSEAMAWMEKYKRACWQISECTRN